MTRCDNCDKHLDTKKAIVAHLVRTLRQFRDGRHFLLERKDVISLHFCILSVSRSLISLVFFLVVHCGMVCIKGTSS